MPPFNELFDLAAVASGAGLAGGGTSALLAMAVSGAIRRFIVRLLMTAVLTGVGFYLLLGWLGFEIVPRDEIAQAPEVTPRQMARSMPVPQSPGFLPQEETSHPARVRQTRRRRR